MTMRPPTKPLLPELQKESRAFLEQFAATELNPAVVRVKVFDAAKAGHTSLRLTIPLHLDVQKTDAAVSFSAWCKEAGLSLTWESRSGDTADGRRAVTYEPVISW